MSSIRKTPEHILLAYSLLATDTVAADTVAAAADTPAVDVASTIAKYDLLAVPVVDDAGKMLGIVTVDDAIDAIMPADIAKKLPHMRARHRLHTTPP